MFWPTVPLLLVCVALGSCQPAANVEFDKILADIAMGRATIDPNVVSPSPISHFGQLESSDLYKGIVECMNHDECLGANRICSHTDGKVTGRCACKEGYVPSMQGFSCLRKASAAQSKHVTCETDEDCNRNEVCMSWQYDPALEYARKLRSQLSPGGDQPETHKFCIDAWIICNNHLEDLDEPRTGGGLRSNRKNFRDEEYYFSGGRPPRQYSAFGEDMMLILFLVCILATLVTVHRAACNRQIQDARRNTPLRHILPIPEDRPPPYTHRSQDTVDGLTSIVCSSPGSKPLTEAPPPSYEEALDRHTVRLTDIEEQAGPSEQQELTGADLAREEQDNDTANLEGVTSEPSEDIVLQAREEILEPPIPNSANIDIVDTELERLEPTCDDQILPEEQVAANANIGEDEDVYEEVIVTDRIQIHNEDLHIVETAESENTENVHHDEMNKTDEHEASVVNNDNEINIAGEESEKLIKDTDDSITCESEKSSNVVHV